MFNFGYSLWLVPTNYNINTVHIPHITIAACIDKIPKVSADINKLYKVKLLKENIVKFPTDMYNNNTTIESYGIYCKILNLDLQHDPHLTLSYHIPDYKHIKLPTHLYCNLYLAETLDINPLNWKLIKKY